MRKALCAIALAIPVAVFTREHVIVTDMSTFVEHDCVRLK
jgi:hypothetical protein